MLPRYLALEVADHDVARVAKAHGVAAVSAREGGLGSCRRTFDDDAGACAHRP